MNCLFFNRVITTSKQPIKNLHNRLTKMSEALFLRPK